MRFDPNREMMRQVALQLDGLTDQLVFVGGVTVGLLITDPASPAVRPTRDVDVITIIESHADYYRLGEQLRRCGFKEDQSEGAPLCRWVAGGWILDVMPTDEQILGFSNRWYRLAALTAEPVSLDADITIRVITAPCFIATKLEAFKGRGRADFLGSHDLEDIVGVVDGRPELVEECVDSPAELRAYLSNEVGQLLGMQAFNEALPGHVLDAGRLPIVRHRLEALARLIG